MNSHARLDLPDGTRREAVGQADGRPLRIVDSATLFDGAREIGIEHEGALYRLKITRQGKLILNK